LRGATRRSSCATSLAPSGSRSSLLSHALHAHPIRHRLRPLRAVPATTTDATPSTTSKRSSRRAAVARRTPTASPWAWASEGASTSARGASTASESRRSEARRPRSQAHGAPRFRRTAVASSRRPARPPSHRVARPGVAPDPRPERHRDDLRAGRVERRFGLGDALVLARADDEPASEGAPARRRGSWVGRGHEGTWRQGANPGCTRSRVTDLRAGDEGRKPGAPAGNLSRVDTQLNNSGPPTSRLGGAPTPCPADPATRGVVPRMPPVRDPLPP
jgi:hypothetical protein